jgi:hypothetical protein
VTASVEGSGIPSTETNNVDFRAVAELVLMASVGVTMITVAVGFTVRLFLGPVLRDVADRFATRPSRDERALLSRLDQLDDRLSALENGVDRLEAAQDFDRRLSAVDPRKSETG